MVEQFATPPINPVVSIRPLSTPSPGRDATQVPPALASLPPGTLLEGFVVNRDAQNNPILRTSAGDLQMQSDVFVKTGSQMVIRVDATVDSRARIVSIDGLPPQDYASQNLRGLTQDTIMPPQLRAAMPLPAGAPATTPQAMQAVLVGTPGSMMAAAPNPLFLSMPGAQMPVPAALAKLQVGAMLKVTVLQMDLPAALAGPAAVAGARPAQATTMRPQAPVTPQTAAAGTAPGHATAPIPPSPERAAIAPVGMADARTAKIAQEVPPTGAHAPAAPPAKQMQAPPQAALVRPAMTPLPSSAAPLPNAPMPQPAPTVAAGAPPAVPAAAPGEPALVIGHEPDGANVLHTRLGVMKLYTAVPLPTHTQLRVDIAPQPRPTNPTPGAPTADDAASDAELAPLTAQTRGWPKLAEALNTVMAQEPSLARDMMNPLPQMGQKLTSGLLFFMAAVKGGDLRQWLGARATERLELRFPEIAARLKTDMVQMQQLLLHSPLDQWSGTMLPMLQNGQLEYARFYLRDEQQGKDGQQGGGKEQRFLVEIDLSHLGEMQFDGFIRPGQAKKQFDLIIRTARPLEAGISEEIRQMFETSIATTGYTGYLGFQQGSHHFVRPLARSNEGPQDHHTILA